MRKIFLEMLSYGIWGGVSTAINLVLFFVFIRLGMYYIVSNIVSYFIAVLLSYYFNVKFVFDVKKEEQSIKGIMKYFIVRIVSIGVDSTLLWLIVDYAEINVYVGKIAVSLFVIIITYIFNRIWVFKKGK